MGRSILEIMSHAPDEPRYAHAREECLSHLLEQVNGDGEDRDEDDAIRDT